MSQEQSFEKFMLKVVRMSGKKILKNKKKLIAHLSDLGPEYKKEIRIFRQSCSEDVLQMLYAADSSDTKTYQRTLNRAKYLLTEEEGLSETWAARMIDAVSGVLGVEDSLEAEEEDRCPCQKQEKEITDSWNSIISAIDCGIYRDRYRIGNMKTLELGKEGRIHMQIAAFDTDPLAGGAGKASVTWIGKELLNTPYFMEDMQGENSRWGNSKMRLYLKTTVKTMLPEMIQGRIRTVAKKQEACGTEEFTEKTRDDIWIPDYYEVSFRYTDLFSDRKSRIKKYAGSQNVGEWWLRRAPNAGKYNCIMADGSSQSAASSRKCGIALGFCM